MAVNVYLGGGSSGKVDINKRKEEAHTQEECEPFLFVRTDFTMLCVQLKTLPRLHFYYAIICITKILCTSYIT